MDGTTDDPLDVAHYADVDTIASTPFASSHSSKQATSTMNSLVVRTLRLKPVSKHTSR